MTHADGVKEDTEDAINHQEILFEMLNFGFIWRMENEFFFIFTELTARYKKQGGKLSKNIPKIKLFKSPYMFCVSLEKVRKIKNIIIIDNCYVKLLCTNLASLNYELCLLFEL